MPLRGVIFDLDGTLVDSGLDFAAIRRDLGLSPGELILESVDKMPPGAEKDERLLVLRKHELQGARRATLMPGAGEFLAKLNDDGIRTAVLTRNSREATDLTLRRLGLKFSLVMTRDEVPPKPDPTGLLVICESWDIAPAESIYIGDYLFDIQAGQNAGMPTMLYAPGNLPDYANLADFTVQSFPEALELIAHMGGISRPD